MISLFSPLQLGAVKAPNRILMAPLTRCRADAEQFDAEHVPTALMAEYHAQIASVALTIAEATTAMEGNSSFWMEPGMAAHAAGWRLVTDAVHAAGGRTFPPASSWLPHSTNPSRPPCIRAAQRATRISRP